MKEEIFINGISQVSIQYKDSNKEEVEDVYIDGKKYDFENEHTIGKKEFAQQTKRNKYKSFLNNQFENLLVLTGAGSSVGIGEGEKKGQLMTGLWDATEELIGKEILDELCELVHYKDKEENGEKYIKNLEKLLSYANSAKDYVKAPSNEESISDVIKKIENLIKDKCELSLPFDAPHKSFIEKITKRKVTLPRVKVFTLNYDTFFEQAGKIGNFTIIDGFSFSFPRVFSGRNFDYDIVQRDNSRVKEEDNFIRKVFHLYKPHGSVDWTRDEKGNVIQTEKVDNALMIYPKESKYESSYEQPFFEMMSRFQQNLRKDNTLLICIGFSFNDKHINTAIQEALEQNPSFQIVVLNKGISKAEGFNSELYRLAKQNSSIVLIDELFSDFAENYPDLKSYNQDDFKKIVIDLNKHHNE